MAMAMATDDGSAGADLPAGIALAIIMDGNGRWASQRGLTVTEGHRAGARALRRCVEAAIDLTVAELTVYAFSTENWSRSPEEVTGILDLFCEMLDEQLPELHAQGVRIRFLGRHDVLPEELTRRMRTASDVTGGNSTMTLAIAFNYGGRAEIVDAARTIAARDGADAITEQSIAAALHAPDMREPDLIVRTAGEQRTSNFLVWQGAYSELVFIDVLWPDFERAHLSGALAEYATRDRRFGGRT